MIPTTLPKTWILSVLIAFFAAVSFGQVMTRVEGTIIGTDGKPVQGAEIKFERTDIRANYSIKTNRDGKFNYATLPQGVYTITVTVNGNVIARQEGIRTNPANPIPLNIDMRQLQQTQAAAAQPVVEERKPTAEEIAEFEKKKKEYEDAMLKDKALQETFSAAMQAREAKNWNLAIENFIKASEIDPTQEAVWANLADTYTMRAETLRGAAAQADYGRAADAYAKAVALKPADASLHNNYAIVAARSQRVDVAQAELAKAIELDPAGAAKYYRNLGTVYFDTNQSAQAEATFRKAIELDPKNPDAYYRLGLVLVQNATVEGDKMKAPPGTVEAFQKYLELAPNGPNAAEAKSMLDVLGSPVPSNLKR